MKRRLLIKAAFAASPLTLIGKEKDPKVVTDQFELNAFAEMYNGYVDKLAAGQIDLVLWKRIVNKWKRMTE